MSDLLTMEEAAEWLRTPEPTLKYWRSQGTGPPAAKIGRRVLYRKADLDQWVEDQFNKGEGKR